MSRQVWSPLGRTGTSVDWDAVLGDPVLLAAGARAPLQRGCPSAAVGERVVEVTADCGQRLEAQFQRDRQGVPVLAWYADGGAGQWIRSLVVPVAAFLGHPRREPFLIGQQPLKPGDLRELQAWVAHEWGRGALGMGAADESFAERELLAWRRAELAERWWLGRERPWLSAAREW